MFLITFGLHEKLFLKIFVLTVSSLIVCSYNINSLPLTSSTQLGKLIIIHWQFPDITTDIKRKGVYPLYYLRYYMYTSSYVQALWYHVPRHMTEAQLIYQQLHLCCRSLRQITTHPIRIAIDNKRRMRLYYLWHS